ncbi:hypothetical protein, partial [Nodularia spumigena]|uniref:hypothetical protein n=1 Tax=Nodularia spumigena TaxID=70799 RepID=UPI002B21DD40
EEVSRSKKAVKKGGEVSKNSGISRKGNIFSTNKSKKAGVFVEVNPSDMSRLADFPGFTLRRVSPNGSIAIGYLDLDYVQALAKGGFILAQKA